MQQLLNTIFKYSYSNTRLVVEYKNNFYHIFNGISIFGGCFNHRRINSIDNITLTRIYNVWNGWATSIPKRYVYSNMHL